MQVRIMFWERFFGIGGMVVGVPIGYYVIGVLTAREEGLASE